jgi:hypothetical protein
MAAKANIMGTEIALARKEFTTGSEGFHGNSTVIIDGVNYFANILLIEEGSSPKAKGESRARFLLRKKDREVKATK